MSSETLEYNIYVLRQRTLVWMGQSLKMIFPHYILYEQREHDTIPLTHLLLPIKMFSYISTYLI